MRRLGGRFVVEEELGSGGMGCIHRGRDERLGDEVAVKILKPGHLADPVLRERFRREARSLAKLRHPGIVTVLDFGEAESGELYTVLELVRGATLERVMNDERPLSVARAAPLFEQILAALEVCHAHSVVHRDLKPSNVMITTVNGLPHVKLIDFGLARAGTDVVDKLTETGTVHGTPHYMAPEQCRGEEVGPAGDVYSAGVLFYEMLAGENPFRGTDAATFMAQHLFVDPAPLHQIAPRVSAGLSAAIGAALAKHAHDRPTARELRLALAAALGGTDPEARGAAAATLRRQVSGLERRQRVLPASATSPGARPAPRGNVIVWVADADRSAALRSCLATAGFACSRATGREPPVTRAEDAAVLVSARDGLGELRPLRERAPSLAVVVVDVDGPSETTDAIRAGASDMLLREAPDTDLVPKLDRLLRRRRARP